jgi:hypothetical protein
MGKRPFQPLFLARDFSSVDDGCVVPSAEVNERLSQSLFRRLESCILCVSYVMGVMEMILIQEY